MKKLFIRLPLEGKLSPKVTDEVENLNNDKHLIRQTSSATCLAAARSPSGSDSRLDYHSIPSGRSATQQGRLNRKDSRSRRGFTLVEVVVALVIIVLVSGISIGVVTVNNKAHAETIDMIEATNIAENAIECFRFAVNNPDDIAGSQVIFDPAFEKCFDPIKREKGEINISKEFKSVNGNACVDTYTVTDGRITVVIVLKDSEDDDEIYESITITATNGGTNEFLLEPKTYTVR